MKTLVTCAGLAVVGALAANAQTIGEPSMSKLWSVSAKLRGFYDDNYNTAKSDPAPGYPHKQHSWGVSFAPSVAVNWIRDLTSLHLRYNYDMRWYENRPEEEVDHTHVADVTLFHDFSEIHDGHLVADVLDHRHVMGDEKIGKPEGLLEPGQKIEDLGLDGHIQGGDRLVADHEVGSGGQGPGDAQSLALSA